MKKIVTLCMALVLLLSGAMIRGAQAEDKIKIVATTFPSYDWTKNIISGMEDKFELMLLQDKGVDLHNFQPTAEDFMKLSTANMLIYVGGVSDGWVNDAVKSAKNDNLKLISLVKELDDKVKTEQMVEGMQEAPHAHGHDEEHDHHHPSFKREDVEMRELKEFAGAFRNLSAYIKEGAFDKVAEARKKEGKSAEEFKNDLLKHFGEEIDYLTITEDALQIVVDGKVTEEAKYVQDGIYFDEPEEGHLHAMYQYKKLEGSDALPAFVMLNDHQIKANQEREANPHFHLVYSNESYEKAYASEASPFMVPAGLTAKDLEDWFMPGEEKHDHDHEGHEHEEKHEEHGKDEKHEDEHKHEEHKHDDHDHDHDHAHIDEHVWLSLVNAAKLVDEIADELAELAPEMRSKLLDNAHSYKKQLFELDEKYRAMVKESSKDTVLFGDRFPFRYLMDDYNIKYFAAFSGCAAETEASFETVAFLANKTNELKLSNVLVLEGSNNKIADAVISASDNQQRAVRVLNSMQSISMEEIKEGKNYLGIMEQNLEVLREALK